MVQLIIAYCIKFIFIFIKSAKGVNTVKEFLDSGKLGCFRTLEEFVYGNETVKLTDRINLFKIIFA